MSDLALAVQQGFGLVLWLALPLVLAAALGSLVATLLGSFSGLQDATLSLVLRSVAVVLALVFLASRFGSESVALTEMLWDRIGDVGRGR